MKGLNSALIEANRVLEDAPLSDEVREKLLRYLKQTAIRFFWRGHEAGRNPETGRPWYRR